MEESKTKKPVNLVLVALLIAIISLLTVQPAYSIPSGYSTKAEIIRKFESLDNSYTIVSSEVIGRTVKGEAIKLWRIGNFSSNKIVLVDASRHGGEYVTTEALYIAVSWILTSGNKYAKEILKYQLLVVPIVNLDMYQKSRYNYNGVDLNRNFEFKWYSSTDIHKGSSPCSEPETKAFEYVFTAYNISWYLTLHAGDYRITPAYWSGMSHPTELYKGVYAKISSISKELGVSSIPLKLYQGYAGTSTNDAYYSHKIFSFTVECSYSYLPSYSTIRDYIAKRIEAVIAGVFTS